LRERAHTPAEDISELIISLKEIDSVDDPGTILGQMESYGLEIITPPKKERQDNYSGILMSAFIVSLIINMIVVGGIIFSLYKCWQRNCRV
jgi:hypothetical protein